MCKELKASTIVNSDAENRILKSKLPLLIQFDCVIKPTIILFPMDNYGCTNTYGVYIEKYDWKIFIIALSCYTMSEVTILN